MLKHVWVLLLLAGLAGCADKGGEAPQECLETDPACKGPGPVEVDETHGGIRGVVVDQGINPIADVTIKILIGGAAQETTSDANGNFVFSKILAGTYFLEATKPLYNATQFAATVVAGDANPPVVKVQMNRLFSQDPYMVPYPYKGHIQCSQAGIVYASAPCITDFTAVLFTPGLAPQLREIQQETRDFTESIGPGWQNIIWEMEWDASLAGTSQNMGLTASYSKLERCACHNFLSVTSGEPLYARLDLGVDHPTSNSADPELLAPEGHPELYTFISVRRDSAAPAVAVEQDFEMFMHVFYYGIAPDGWSFLNGDDDPFGN